MSSLPSNFAVLLNVLEKVTPDEVTAPVVTQIPLEDMMRSHEGLDRQAVVELKDWNATQLHLPKLVEADLALFYLNNNYDMQATKRNIVEYFLMRHHAPELFAISRKDLQGDATKVFNAAFIVELPDRTKDSQKIFVARLVDSDASHYDFAAAAKALNMVLDMGAWEDGPDDTYLLIFDVGGPIITNRANFNWQVLRKLILYLRKGCAVRCAGMHFTISASSTSLCMIRSFVESTIINKADLVDGQKLHYHENIEAMCDATGIERAMLPHEMGGQADNAMELQTVQMKKLESHYAFLAGMENRKKLTATQGVPTAVEVFGPEMDF